MTDPTTDAGQALPDPRPSRPRPVGRQRAIRLVRIALLAFVLVLAVVTADAALLTARLDRLDVELRAGEGTTWVLVGLDSRAHLPPGADVSTFGTPQDVPGSRADVVVVVHVPEAGPTTVLSVPRDVVVGNGRLALTWLDGPQAMLDGLCGLGIPSDHLVAVDLGGFAAIVDAVGGLDVDVPRPVRDPAAGLELRAAGPRHVDGDTALAMVRSRHPEELVAGDWSPATVDPDGRAGAAARVLDALADAVRARPWRAQHVAWAASGALAVDTGTSPGELAGLLTADLERPVVLPVADPPEGTWARFPTPATTTTLADAGLSCSVQAGVS
jgi:LCP family protein required for cell wall assembly